MSTSEISPDFSLDWESPFVKSCAALPIMGDPIAYLAYSQINQQLERIANQGDRNAIRAIRLIDLKNDYLTANIARGVIGCAMAVVFFVFSGFFAGIASAFYATSAVYSFLDLMRNKALIIEIAENGLRDGMVLQ